MTGYANFHLKQLNKKGSKLSAVIWMQGEADRGSTINYKEHFKKMKTKLLQGIGIGRNFKIIVTQSTICDVGGTSDELLSKQQRELAKDKNIYVTDVADSLGPSFRIPDNCHLNESGTEAVAKEISSILNG